MNAPRPSPAVRLADVSIEIGGRTLLRVHSLHIDAGERVALVGSNGAGKSTLLRVMSGPLQPAQGEVEVFGRRLDRRAAVPMTRARWRVHRAEVGQVMQGLHLVPRLTALENVLLGALARRAEIPAWRTWTRLYPAPVVAEARLALDRLGLLAGAGVRADRLSGGERQKVAIARLTMQRPRLILADEPTSALDPASTAQAVAALLHAARRATIVSVVHQASLLPALAERVIGLSGGRIAFDLPRAQVDDRVLADLYRADQAPPPPTGPIPLRATRRPPAPVAG